jgi:tetraacyldisaccharide 4'-kinase
LIDKAYIEDIMYGRKSSRFWGALLFFLSLVNGVLVQLRSALYRFGVFRTKKLPCRVISVGNITLGGTGKTPTVINIAGLMLQYGRSPLVLSRGYGRPDESSMVVVSDGVSPVLDPAVGGDEPALIANRLRTVPVVVGSDRHRAGTFAIGRFHPDCIILDDGFQHIRLQRDLNIVLIDAGDPFGSGKLFPAGILREPLSALRRADIVVIMKVDEAGDVVHLKETIRSHTAAQILTARYAPRDLVNTMSGEVVPLTVLRGSRVFTFAGIARPGSLDSLLESLGAIVAGSARFPDHHSYTDSDIERVLQSAAECKATMVVTTEKDSVRLKGMAPEAVWALRIDLDVLERASWEEVLAGKL